MGTRCPRSDADRRSFPQAMPNGWRQRRRDRTVVLVDTRLKSRGCCAGRTAWCHVVRCVPAGGTDRRHRPAGPTPCLGGRHPGVYVDHTGPSSWRQRAWAAVLLLRAGRTCRAPRPSAPTDCAGTTTTAASRLPSRPPAIPARRAASAWSDLRKFRRGDAVAPVAAADAHRSGLVAGRVTGTNRGPHRGGPRGCMPGRQVHPQPLGGGAGAHSSTAAPGPHRERAGRCRRRCTLRPGAPLPSPCRAGAPAAPGPPSASRQWSGARRRVPPMEGAHRARRPARPRVDHGPLGRPGPRRRLRLVGHLTVRIGWRQVLEPCRLAERVGQILAARGWQGRTTPCGPRCPLG